MAIKYKVNAVNGEMVLDDSPVSKRLIRHGIYEPIETEFFKKNLKENDVFLDIGAHVGYYSLMASKILTKGKVYSFEPYVNTYELLMENVDINQCKNVTTYCMGVSDKNEISKLHIDEANKGNCSLYHQKDCDNITIETITIDSMFRGKKVDFVKIDTQGAEINVLLGMKKTIEINDMSMIIEFYPYGLRQMGHKPVDFFKVLSTLGFGIYKMRADGILSQIFNFNKFAMNIKSHTNLFCIKR